MTFIILTLFFGTVYLLPGLVASSRGTSRRAGIWVLNIFLGWTFVGYIGALIWAVSGDKEVAR